MNTSYGLVLGGWAAKWISHIGVITSLLEHQIKITEIAGTSMGAIIWAAFALWMSPKEMENIIAELNFIKLIDLNLKSWIISGNKISKRLEQIFQNARIEETKIPLKIVATDIDNEREVVFTQGKVSDCIRASISIPTVFVPAVIEGTKFLDGGLSENLPILTMESQNIIAVSCIRELWKIPQPRKKKVFWVEIPDSYFNHNYQMLKKTFSIAMKLNEDLCLDFARLKGKNIILISPNTQKFEFHDFLKYKELIQIGYKEGQRCFYSL